MIFSIKPGAEYVRTGGRRANAIDAQQAQPLQHGAEFRETPKGVMIIGTPGGSYIISMVIPGVDICDRLTTSAVVKRSRASSSVPDHMLMM